MPSGHPFINVQLEWYWTATTVAIPPTPGRDLAGTVNFSPMMYNTGWWDKQFNYANVWCVRGGSGVDAQ